MSQLSPTGRYLREHAWETVRQGQTTFTIASWMFFDGLMPPPRPGFTVADEMEEFCWLSECSYFIVETRLGKCFSVRVPEFVFWEYQLALLNDRATAMESYQ